MTKQVQRRRGTATQHTSFTGAEGEISVNTTNKSVHVHDGVTAGGFEAARADLGNVSDASLNTALAGNTLSSLTITSADINGGTIDGTVIGGTTPAAGSFTQANFGDNNKAIFGAGSDLQIYHDGSNSYVHDAGVGSLILRATNFRLYNADETKVSILANDGGETKLYYDGSSKLATTSTGVDVTGTVTADGLTNSGSSTLAGNIFFNSTSGAFRFGTDAGTEKMTLRLDGDDLKLENGAGFERVRFTNGGNVGIGTSLPLAKLHVESASGSGGRVLFGGSTTSAYSTNINVTDTGMEFWAQSNSRSLTFSTGSTQTERMRITSSGNVGIGTSSPQSGLHLRNPADAASVLAVDHVSGGNGYGGYISSIGSGANQGLILGRKFNSTFNEAMRINSSGNVGIGSTNPQDVLDLANGSAGRGITWAGVNGSARYNSIFSSYSGASLVLSSLFHGSTSADSYVTSFTGTTRASGIRLNWTNDNGIQFFTDTAAAKTAGNAFVPSERMRITSTGNVGIGTSSPAAQLHLAGQTNGTLRVDTSASGYLDLSMYSNGGFVATSAAQPLRLGTNNTERLRIDSSGNVGIGTSSPGQKLSVNGSAEMQSAGRINFLNSDNSNYYWIYNIGATGSANAALSIQQSGVGERLRIDSSGNLLVGTTSNGAKLAVVSSANQTKVYVEGYGSGVGRGIDMKAGVDSASAIVFNNSSGTSVGSITQTTTATAYNTSSDYRLKEDVQPMVGASDRVLSLNPVNFAWKADGSRTDGFIAHEVQEVAPYAVTGEKDGEDMQAMDHSKLVPLLTAALQEALGRITALEAEVASLKA